VTAQKKAVGVLATPATVNKRNHTDFLAVKRRVKSALVAAALNGWLPFAVAGWLIRHGGLLHV
jgi:glutamate racemase